MGIAELWSTTASDDVALSNRMAERHVKPFYVPLGVATSCETHHSLPAMMKWYNRQSLTGKLHELTMWLAGLVIESLVSLALVGSVVLLVVEAATGSLEYHAFGVLVVVGAIVACGLTVKLSYPPRKDIPLWQWALLPLFGHLVVATSFWVSAFQTSMTWGSFTYKVGRDGKVIRIETGSARIGDGSAGVGRADAGATAGEVTRASQRERMV